MSGSNKKSRDAGEIFPCDVITEILSRLAPKSLMKFQLVRKDWKAIVHSPHFVEKHMNGSEITQFYYSGENNVGETDGPSGYEDPRNNAIDYCRYGLILLWINDYKSYCLWNPAIRQLLQLPDPQKHSYGFAISHISASRRFKLISFYKDGDSGEACEVCVPGYSKAWKRLASFPVAQVIGERSEQRVSVVAAGEDVHCIRVVKVGTQTFGEVVSVDMGTESFTVTPVRKGVFKSGSIKVQALDWNGKLGFWDLVGKNLELMVLEDCKNHKWSDNKKTIHLSFMEDQNYSEDGSFMPLYAKDGDVWFLLNFEEVYIFTMGTGKVTEKNKICTRALPAKFFTYNPSMASFEGMQPDTKLSSTDMY